MPPTLAAQPSSPTPDPHTLLAAVLSANEGTRDPRSREILDSLIRHLHAFALEVDLQPHELDRGLDGKPIAGARVETWQASPKGLYENQDTSQQDMNLRGRFETDVEGRFSFVSVRPAGYPVPVDGPCGELLAAQGRHSMRPAHLHFIVIAPGYKVLATQFFDADDPHAFDDVVFSAVGSLLRHFEPDGEGGDRLDIELRLEPGETRVPACPLP